MEVDALPAPNVVRTILCGRGQLLEVAFAGTTSLLVRRGPLEALV